MKESGKGHQENVELGHCSIGTRRGGGPKGGFLREVWAAMEDTKLLGKTRKCILGRIDPMSKDRG